LSTSLNSINNLTAPGSTT